LKKIAVFITKILRVFGLVDQTKEFGFRSTESVPIGTQSREEILRPYIEAFNRYRNQIRTAVKVHILLHCRFLFDFCFVFDNA
jgi:hypothetical protein